MTASGALYANGAYDDSCGFGTSGSSLISPLQAVPIPGGLHVLQFAGGDGWGAAVAGPGLPGVPTVTGLSPANGPAAGGNTVTVAGNGFASGAAVYFGTHAATNVTVTSSKSITVTAPAGSGTVDVFVALNGTSSPLTSADRYTYTASAGTSNGTSGTNGSSTSGSTKVSGASSSGGSAAVSVSCAGAAGSVCHVGVSLSIVVTVGAGGRVLAVAARAGDAKTKTKRRTVVLGSRRLMLMAGGSERVRLSLNATGRRLLSSRHRLEVRLAVTSSGKLVHGQTLNFTRKKPHR